MSLLLLVLICIAFLLPKVLVRTERPARKQEFDLVMDSFQEVAGEIKSLREQLLLKERLATLGEISAGIAHEFRNPMAVITGYSRLLLKGMDEADPRRELVQGVLNEVDAMNKIMEELIKFSRSEPVTKVPVDMARLVAEVLESFGEERGQVTFQAPETAMVGGDETLLRQAVKNLIQNAVDSGGDVWLGFQRTRVSGMDHLSFIVKDTGPGIPPENLKKIFTPFFTTRAEGIGIGLPLVQKIAIAHGGTIDVESFVGKGSTFKLTVPSA